MPRVEATARRLWIPFVVLVACLVGVAAVYRLHGLFGANTAALIGGTRSEKIIEINPKNVTYQLFGTPNTSGTISFLDGNSQPQTANFAALPWQLTKKRETLFLPDHCRARRSLSIWTPLTSWFHRIFPCRTAAVFLVHPPSFLNTWQWARALWLAGWSNWQRSLSMTGRDG